MNRVPPNKWAPLVKRPLGEGVQPFGELRRAVPRASPKERTRGLRSLDRDVFLAVLLDVYAGTAEHWDGLVDARERADRPEAGSPVDNVLTRNSQVPVPAFAARVSAPRIRVVVMRSSVAVKGRRIFASAGSAS